MILIYVSNMAGSLVEPLINISDDFEMVVGVDGTLTVSFTTFPNSKNAGYDYLKTGSIVTVDDLEFYVLSCEDRESSKTVSTVSTFYLNSKKQVKGLYSGDNSFTSQINFVMADTGWVVGIDPLLSNKSITIPELGNNSVTSLVETICSHYQCEYEIGKNNIIHFRENIGKSNDYQFRYKYNVSDVVLKEDITNLYTRITGIGAEGISITYTSPNSAQFGILEAPTITEEGYTTLGELSDYIKTQLNDTPDILIESTATVLTDLSIGEKVWLIYEPLRVEFETRILELHKTLVGNELVVTSVSLGNTIPKTINDVIVDQTISQNETEKELEESKKEYRSAITQTDDRITLEVERIDHSIAMIDIKADNINLSVNNRITNEIAQVDIRANQIQLSVNDLKNQTNSSITLLDNQIALKVDVGGSITDINLTNGNATINASKINLNGAVMASGSITGNSTINVGTDLYVGNNIYLANGSNSDKSIIFGGVSRIDGDWGNITVSAPNVRIESNVVLGNGGATVGFNGTVDFSSASNIRGVARANSSGIGISTNGSKLFVQVNGTTIGEVLLT